MIESLDERVEPLHAECLMFLFPILLSSFYFLFSSFFSLDTEKAHRR